MNVYNEKLNEVIRELPAGLQKPLEQYGPAIFKLGAEQFWAFIRALVEDDARGAYEILTRNMTTQELIAEKARLTDLVEMMAHENAQVREFAETVFKVVCKVALRVVIGI